ncbi:MAG: head-tail connector protein [Pseudomonadota bacterium]
MELICLEAPAIEPVTVAELLAQARIDGAEENELLGRLISTARAHVESLTQRSLLRQRWSLQIDGFPVCGLLRLPRAPVVAIQSVKYLDFAGAEQTLSGTAYRLVGGLGMMPKIVPAVGLQWPKTADVIGAVTIEYQAGLLKPTDLPPAIRHAILMLAAHWFEHREAVIEASGRGGLLPVPMAVDSLLSPHVVPWIA